MTADGDVLLPARIVGPSLTVAGLATWIFLHAGRDDDAEQCGRLQDLIDSALRDGSSEVRVPRAVVSGAASSWDTAARLAEAWGESGPSRESAEWGVHAERLRIRADALRRLLED